MRVLKLPHFFSQIAGWVGLVIGAKGATVKQLMQDFGVQIRVHDDFPGEMLVLRPWHCMRAPPRLPCLPAGKETAVVSGERPAAVDAAIAKIKSMIDIARAAGPPANTRPAFMRAVQLPVGSESQVIGIGGATIKAICQVRRGR